MLCTAMISIGSDTESGGFDLVQCDYTLTDKGICPNKSQHVLTSNTEKKAEKGKVKTGSEEKAAATWLREADSSRNRAMLYYERAAKLYKDAGNTEMYDKMMSAAKKMVIEDDE